MSEGDTDEIDADALIDMMDKDNMIDIVLRIMRGDPTLQEEIKRNALSHAPINRACRAHLAKDKVGGKSKLIGEATEF